jgi:HPt (histidine-containing phosphotransfer) domain-containing protein
MVQKSNDKLQKPSAKRGGELVERHSDPILDHAHLAHYTMENQALEREIIALFLAQLPMTLKDLLEARTFKDWKTATHGLKGASLAIGACRIEKLIRKLEAVPVFTSETRRQRLLDDLKDAAKEFEVYVKNLYH